jgi:hypothetical protein
MSSLKAAVEAYLATPVEEDARRTELFDAIEQIIYADFEAEPDMTEEKMAQLDVTALAQAYIERAAY